VRIDQSHLDRELLQSLLELGDGAAVEMGRGDHFVAGGEERHQRDELRRHAAGNGERAGGPLERGHPLLEHGGGRVADPRVDVAVLLELKKLGRLVRAVEDVGGRLVNGHRARPGDGVGNVPGVDHPGLKAEFAGRGTIRHRDTLSQAAFHPSKMRVAQSCRRGMLIVYGGALASTGA
jgi:hypothetical protein